VLTGLQTALKLSQFGGSIYVFTDSPYSDSSDVLIDVFTRAERMGAKVHAKATCMRTHDTGDILRVSQLPSWLHHPHPGAQRLLGYR
jgi:hypothetical protein